LDFTCRACNEWDSLFSPLHKTKHLLTSTSFCKTNKSPLLIQSSKPKDQQPKTKTKDKQIVTSSNVGNAFGDPITASSTHHSPDSNSAAEKKILLQAGGGGRGIKKNKWVKKAGKDMKKKKREKLALSLLRLLQLT
jgi:hypothetical protein